MQHAHNGGIVVDRKESAVRFRLPPVRQYSDRMIGVEALGDGTPLRMLVQRQHRPFETVEPPGTLLRRTIDDPQVRFLEIGFRAPR